LGCFGLEIGRRQNLGDATRDDGVAAADFTASR
jgi:hypothetical protein